MKWQRYSGLTLFLPHGYEGQGPEHSSARMERFLTLCADENMQVCYPSSAAQIFHLLRRQMKQTFRKPLIVMTPKSMLRLPAARCLTRDLTDGRFRTIIDPMTCKPEDVTKVILCTGKIYYELENRREELARKDLEIIRVEQLYPLDRAALQEVIDRYPNAKRFLWAQEEPENNGAWRFIESRFRRMFGLDLEYVGRDENASPAVGSLSISNLEHIAILDRAVGSLESGHEDPEATDPVDEAAVDGAAEAVANPGESDPVAARKPARSRGKNSTKSRRKNKAS